MKPLLTPEQITVAAYGAMRELARATCHGVAPPWCILPDELRQVFIATTAHRIEHVLDSPESIFSFWTDQMISAGWHFGAEVDYEEKVTPVLRPFDDLSWEDQAQFFLLCAVVDDLCQWGEDEPDEREAPAHEPS